ncbi:response regulator transcription factor [Mesorhizobium sp. M7A.F.Ca.US.006.01.1.1]|uniref:response regulator n=1 Tax=Mesorhizobium sp. M7A.F.Ca.US.006.01.1.1 TaxID=2496707 RepID=UPI000FCB13AE|nr:response regulator transcription factor [Mesorhizobium sp. M7A.F.Ca.US.006.01.1.1]RUZ73101.1 response regulator transcription factor [Mesorhizobium sp. M7A.F.Ca.US.006.01.1.1]
MIRPRTKIVIADDHPIIRCGIKAVLEQRAEWWVCAEAADGEAAVRLAREHAAEIVILDYGLPVLNGLEATRQIRRAMPETEVLIYTMHEDEGLVREILRAGARGYLLKSEDDSELLAAVAALNRRQTYFSPRVTEYLLDDFLSGQAVDQRPELTPREREVVRLVAEGESNKRIAARLGVSVKTVDSHRTTAMRKLDLRNVVDLVHYAIRNKLTSP